MIKTNIFSFIVLSLAGHIFVSSMFSPKININRHYSRILSYGSILTNSDLKNFTYKRNIKDRIVYANFPAQSVLKKGVKLPVFLRMSFFEDKFEKPKRFTFNTKRVVFNYSNQKEFPFSLQDSSLSGPLGNICRGKNKKIEVLVSGFGSVMFFRNFSLVNGIYSFANINRILRGVMLESQNKKIWTRLRTLL